MTLANTPAVPAVPLGPAVVSSLSESEGRWNITPLQRQIMEHTFRSHPYPNQDRREQLSRLFDVTPRQVQIWFQNRRQRQRKGLPEDAEVPSTEEELAELYAAVEEERATRASRRRIQPQAVTSWAQAVGRDGPPAPAPPLMPPPHGGAETSAVDYGAVGAGLVPGTPCPPPPFGAHHLPSPSQPMATQPMPWASAGEYRPASAGLVQASMLHSGLPASSMASGQYWPPDGRPPAPMAPWELAAQAAHSTGPGPVSGPGVFVQMPPGAVHPGAHDWHGFAEVQPADTIY